MIKDKRVIQKINLVLDEVLKERISQEEKWGQQDWPILDKEMNFFSPEGMSNYYNIPDEETSRDNLELANQMNDLTYTHILIEEVSEMVCSKNADDVREELIQIAAVAVAMVERIDRNGGIFEVKEE